MAGLTVLPKAQARGLLAALEEELLRRAEEQKIEDPIVRDILPLTDLGLTYGYPFAHLPKFEAWTFYLQDYVGSGWEGWTKVGAVDLKGKIIGFIGAKSRASVGLPFPTATTPAVKFALGGPHLKPTTQWQADRQGASEIKDIWQLESAETEKNKALYTMSPIIYNSGDRLTLFMYLPTYPGTSAYHLELLGKTCESRGETVV